jgi:hypothetical protein
MSAPGISSTTGSTPRGHAALWRGATIAMTEQVLDELKVALFHSATGPADLAAIRWHEQYLAHLDQLAGEPLLVEYEYWLCHHPALTRGMLRAAAARCRAERQALQDYWGEVRP